MTPKTETKPSETKLPERPRYTRKELTADQPTWCAGCGDFGVLATFLKVLEKLQLPQEKIVALSGIGCSSRFPYFVNAYGAHLLHGRSLPFASGVSLARPDLHVFVFGGDGDIFSIGGNHLQHTARKNIKLTLVVMDNFVYGLTKNQTSPTSPIGFKTKTDTWGAVDEPVNPMKTLLAAGATFVARTSAQMPNHVFEMMEKAALHNGFSVVECLSECVQFSAGSLDAASPRKGGTFPLVPAEHDVTDEVAAYKLALQPFPGYFGVFYQVSRPTKNEVEAQVINRTREKVGKATTVDVLRKTFEQFC